MRRLRTPAGDGRLDGRAVLGLVIGAALLAGCASKASRSADVIGPRSGPTDPAVGASYPFDLYTHCGIQNASFDNRWWAADSPTPDDPAKGSNPYTGYVAGTMTLVSATSARFDGPNRLTATFHPLAGTPQPCS